MGFETFAQQLTPVPSGARIFSYFRRSSHAYVSPRPTLLLLHGYPQNSLMWKNFVDDIPPEFSVFVPDLPSYGLSIKQPSPSGDSLAHSKAEWAKDILAALDAVMDPNGSAVPPKVIAYGHDRGARLGYRLALDFPERIVGLAVLDIVPTPFMWDVMRLDNEHRETRASWHWVFLSAPRPFPETLICSNAEWFFKNAIRRWSGSAQQESEALEWVSDSINPYTDPIAGEARVIGSCEDYRAGATHDVKHDLASGINPSDPAKVFRLPILALASASLRRRFPVDDIWESLAPEGMVRSYQIGDDHIGHFLVNESPDEVARRTREWLKDNWGTESRV